MRKKKPVHYHNHIKKYRLAYIHVPCNPNRDKFFFLRDIQITDCQKTPGSCKFKETQDDQQTFWNFWKLNFGIRCVSSAWRGYQNVCVKIHTHTHSRSGAFLFQINDWNQLVYPSLLRLRYTLNNNKFENFQTTTKAGPLSLRHSKRSKRPQLETMMKASLSVHWLNK